MNIFNTNKKLLKSIALTMLFTSSLNAFDFKFITSLFSKNVSTKAAIAGQSAYAANVLSGSQEKSLNVKSLFGKLSSFVANRPKTFMALSTVALLSVVGFVWRKFISRKLNAILFICAYANCDNLPYSNGHVDFKCFNSGYLMKLLESIDIDMAKRLIKKYANSFDYRYYWSHDKLTPKMAKLLISLGDDINEVDELERTQLYKACDDDRTEIIKELLKCENIDINKGLSPLYSACRNCNIEIVKLLLENGVIINQKFIDNHAEYIFDLYGEINGDNKEILGYLYVAKEFDLCKKSCKLFKASKFEKDSKELYEFANMLEASKRAKNNPKFPNSFNSERALAKFGNCRIKTLT